jgi:hypothetical protein
MFGFKKSIGNFSQQRRQCYPSFRGRKFWLNCLENRESLSVTLGNISNDDS